MENARRDIYKQIFIPDSGALLEIRVFEVTPRDWQTLLDYLSAHHEISYYEDGKTIPLPKFDMIITRGETNSISLKLNLIGFTVNCHFFDIHQIEMDVLPDEIDSSSKADSIFQLMLGIACLLNRQVFLIPESSSTDSQILQESAISLADPNTNQVMCRSGESFRFQVY